MARHLCEPRERVCLVLGLRCRERLGVSQDRPTVVNNNVSLDAAHKIDARERLLDRRHFPAREPGGGCDYDANDGMLPSTALQK